MSREENKSAEVEAVETMPSASFEVEQHVIDAIAQPVIVFDEKGTIVGQNRAAKGCFEGAWKSLAGRNIKELLVETDDLARLALESGEKGALLMRASERNGLFVLPVTHAGQRVRCVVSPVWNSNRRPICYLGTITDDSKGYLGLEAPQLRDIKLKNLFDTPFDLCFECDIEGNFLRANDLCLKTVGYSREEMRKLNINAFFEEEEHLVVLELLKKVVRTGEGTTPHYHKLIKKNGERVYVEASSIPIVQDGKLVSILGIARDITERERTEYALRRSEERFRSLVELLPELVYETNEAGHVTFLNAQGFAQTGFTEDDIKAGLHVTTLFVSDEREISQQIEKQFRGGDILGTIDCSIRGKDGSTFPVITSATPIRQSGGFAGVRGVAIDITKEKQIEERLRQAHKLEAMGTLAGGIAHDINNILSVISGLAELVLKETTSGDPRRKDLEDIVAMTKRGGDFTHNLLGFARQGKLSKERFSINKTIKQIDEILRRSISKKISVGVHLSPDLYDVEGDSAQFAQVIMNLCLNAAEAIDDEGVIIIETANKKIKQPSRGIPPFLEKGMYVEIVVRDDGRGMESFALGRAFEPFFTTKKPDQGTGLGLAMAHGVIKAHGGDITLTSEPQKGTTVTILLPAISAPKVRVSPSRIPSRQQQKKRGVVLLVDDEKLLLSTGRRALERLGYDVITAENGAIALEKFIGNSQKIDLVLMDLDMPVMNGVECFYKLREIDPKVRVLLSSGYADAYNAESLISSGACCFLRKPYMLEKLSEAVSEALATEPDPR